MKGRASNTRHRMKRSHGGRSDRPDAGHALKSGMYRDGGECEGKPASKNLGRAGRRKGKAAGGETAVAGGTQGLTDQMKQMSALGLTPNGDRFPMMDSPQPGAPATASPWDFLNVLPPPAPTSPSSPTTPLPPLPPLPNPGGVTQ